MPIASVNGVRLYYERTGSGEVPVVLVHGSWGSHHQWNEVVFGLAPSFRVLSYDRRGHSASEAPEGQGSVRDDVVDLATLMESLELAPAYVVGNSFGAAITLRLACERPDLVRGLSVHEPPLFSLLAGDSSQAPILADMGGLIGTLIERIAAGDHSGAAEAFMSMALAPGEWAKLPQEFQQLAAENAPTFLDEVGDPEALEFDLERLEKYASPALLTIGEQSPPQYGPVLDRLGGAMPHAQRTTFENAGHLPHVTCPAAFVETTAAFVRRSEG